MQQCPADAIHTLCSRAAAIKEAETRPADAPVRVLFLSEGNTCRSVLAEALFTRLLEERHLSDSVTCESKGTRDYNVGEGPDAATLAVGQALGLNFLAYHVARATDFEVDINLFDMMLPVDKFTAADILRECTVYDTINPKGGYVDKVRTLAEFNSIPGKVTEIDDPLYGSLTPGGPDEVEAVTAAAQVILACCQGLADRLEAIVQQAKASSQPVRPLLVKSLAGMAPVEWVRPPMLSKPLSRAL